MFTLYINPQPHSNNLSGHFNIITALSFNNEILSNNLINKPKVMYFTKSSKLHQRNYIGKLNVPIISNLSHKHFMSPRGMTDRNTFIEIVSYSWNKTFIAHGSRQTYSTDVSQPKNLYSSNPPSYTKWFSMYT